MNKYTIIYCFTDKDNKIICDIYDREEYYKEIAYASNRNQAVLRFLNYFKGLLEPTIISIEEEVL